MPTAICWGATPQQADAKKVEFNTAASAPSVAASGESRSCRKNVHAPRPRINNAMGGKNLAKATGDKTHLNSAVKPSGQEPTPLPMSFRSAQLPVKLAGRRVHSAFCWPSGPSLEKCT